MALRTADFDFAVNNIVVASDVFDTSLRFERGGFQIAITFSSDEASSYTSFERVPDGRPSCRGKIVRRIAVKVSAESPVYRNNADDEDYESDEADAERIDFLTGTLAIAEAVSSEFIEWIRLHQPWIGVHGQRPERIGGPELHTDRATYGYASHLFPSTSAGEPEYPAAAFLDQIRLTELIPLLGDQRPDLPVGETLLADARYFLSSTPADLQRAVLTAAVACEVKVKQTLRAKAPAATVKLLDLLLEHPRDWSLAAIALFDKAADAALGRSLKSDDRQLYQRISRLFELRNKLAHKGEKPDAPIVKDLIAAAQEVFCWLDEL